MDSMSARRLRLVRVDGVLPAFIVTMVALLFELLLFE